MSNKKSHSSDGIGRILKNSLAKSRDPCAVHKLKKDSGHSSHSTAPSNHHRDVGEKVDVSDTVILKALNSIGSRGLLDNEEDCQKENLAGGGETVTEGGTDSGRGLAGTESRGEGKRREEIPSMEFTSSRSITRDTIKQPSRRPLGNEKMTHYNNSGNETRNGNGLLCRPENTGAGFRNGSYSGSHSRRGHQRVDEGKKSGPKPQRFMKQRKEEEEEWGNDEHQSSLERRKCHDVKSKSLRPLVDISIDHNKVRKNLAQSTTALRIEKRILDEHSRLKMTGNTESGNSNSVSVFSRASHQKTSSLLSTEYGNKTSSGVWEEDDAYNLKGLMSAEESSVNKTDSVQTSQMMCKALEDNERSSGDLVQESDIKNPDGQHLAFREEDPDRNDEKESAASSIDLNNSLKKDEDQREKMATSRNDCADFEPASPPSVSAMDKIQNLFACYVSPASLRPHKATSNQESNNACHQVKEDKSTDGLKIHEPAKETLTIDQRGAIQDRCLETGLDKCAATSDVLLPTDLGNKDMRSIRERTVDSAEDVDKYMEELSIRDDRCGGGYDGGSPINRQKPDYSSLEYKLQSKHVSSSSKFLPKSPASIPSGFSSDYDADVGLVSQCDTEGEEEAEDEESPHHPPCAAKLFPSHASYSQRGEVSGEANLPSSSSSEWYGYHHHHHQSQSAPFSNPHPGWHHPSFYQGNHYYHRHPQHHHQYYPQQRHHLSYPPNSSHYLDQLPRSAPSQSTFLTIPAETFSDDASLDALKQFVATKANAWHDFITYHHGHTVPLDVVVTVMPSGVRDGQEMAEESPTSSAPPTMPPPPPSASPYPPPGWHYPPTTYPHPHPPPPSSNVGGYYPPYWSHPYPHGDESGPYPVSELPPRGGEAETNKSSRERSARKVQAANPDRIEPSNHLNDDSDPASSWLPYNPDTVVADSHYYRRPHRVDSEDDAMKRRSSAPVGGDSSDESTDNGETVERVKKVKKNDSNSIRVEKSRLNTIGEKEKSKSTRPASDVNRSQNSVYSFLNPNDLKNEWRSPTRPSASSSLAKRDEDGGEKERDRSPSSEESPTATVMRKNKRSFTARFSAPSEQGESSSLDVVEEKEEDSSGGNGTTSGRQTGCKGSYVKPPGLMSKDGSGDQNNAATSRLDGKWTSPRDSFTSYQRRRSDSVVSYNAEARSPVARDYRLCKTPGMRRNHNFLSGEESSATWKINLMSRSKSYTHCYIDTHCHIDFIYNRTNTGVIPYRKFIERNADSFPVNYGGCVAVFCNPKVLHPRTQAHAILQMLAHETNVWVAVGCHPKNAGDFQGDEHLSLLKNILMKHPKTVALGEIGLDYSGSFHQHADLQKDVFIRQLKLAVELNLPLVIHCRDADDDCLKIMKETVPASFKIHLHCFTRHISIARQWVDHFPNLFVGFTPLITYSSARSATQAAELIPLERLLLETDAPYFVPTGVPLDDVKGVSHPGLALYTAERLAQLKGISVDTVLEHCRRNTRAMYGI